MPALAIWSPEDEVLGAVAPLALGAAAGTALVVDLDPDGPQYPGDVSLGEPRRRRPHEGRPLASTTWCRGGAQRRYRTAGCRGGSSRPCRRLACRGVSTPSGPHSQTEARSRSCRSSPVRCSGDSPGRPSISVRRGGSRLRPNAVVLPRPGSGNDRCASSLVAPRTRETLDSGLASGVGERMGVTDRIIRRLLESDVPLERGALTAAASAIVPRWRRSRARTRSPMRWTLWPVSARSSACCVIPR